MFLLVGDLNFVSMYVRSTFNSVVESPLVRSLLEIPHEKLSMFLTSCNIQFII